MQDSTDAPDCPTLLQALLSLLEAHRVVFGQERVFRRMEALVFGFLFSFARHTLTQALLALGLTDADWSAWYRLFTRPRFAEDELAHCLLQQTLADLPEEAPYVVAVDATQIPRSSHKMPGSGWLKAPRTPPWKPGIHRAQRFVIGNWLLPLQEGFSRALPLRCLAAFPEKAVPAATPAQKEWQAGLSVLGWVRGELDRAGRQATWVLGIGDGGYDVVELWRALPERVVLLARCAKNRRLRALPAVHEGRGRPRKYGERVRSPQEWLHEKEGWQETEVLVRGYLRRMRYRVEGPYLRERAAQRPLFLLVVGGQSWRTASRRVRRRREPAYYLVSAVERAGAWALPFTAQTLLSWVWQRWEVEVAHREMKSGLGVGEMQCWTPRSAVTAVQWGVWLYGVLMLAGYRAWGLLGGPARPGRWWGGGRRWSLATLWRGYRAALWGTGTFRALWSSSGANWGEKEASLSALGNAVGGAARL